jgi:hypothetical protein
MQEQSIKTSAAQRAASKRYKAEKTVSIQAYLPPEYKDKLKRIAELQGCSKAQALKNMIDQAYDVLCSAAENTQE